MKENMTEMSMFTVKKAGISVVDRHNAEQSSGQSWHCTLCSVLLPHYRNGFLISRAHLEDSTRDRLGTMNVAVEDWACLHKECIERPKPDKSLDLSGVYLKRRSLSLSIAI